MVEKSRIEESRDMETRDATIRKNLRMSYQDPLYIDPADIPPDVKYRWIRDSVLGRPDPGRMAVCEKKGWKPVPSSRHPERSSSSSSSNMPSHVKGYIFYEGLILCERLKIYCDIEEEEVNKENYRVQTGIPGVDQLMNDPVMPGRVYANETTVIKTSKTASFGE